MCPLIYRNKGAYRKIVDVMLITTVLWKISCALQYSSTLREYREKIVIINKSSSYRMTSQSYMISSAETLTLLKQNKETL
jgi:hypothetical protein